VIAVRAELDALPITEDTGVPWAAGNGAAHACGHDVHLAALVALARALRRSPGPRALLDDRNPADLRARRPPAAADRDRGHGQGHGDGLRVTAETTFTDGEPVLRNDARLAAVTEPELRAAGLRVAEPPADAR
jgi:peptidase M20/M25/M40-like protein